MTYRLNVNFGKIILVGAGGTGSFVAEGLCRLLINYPDIPIYIIDFDTVEKKNILRQNFYPQDVGKFKAQALAERYARAYNRGIQYSVSMFTPETVELSWGGGMESLLCFNSLIIGCVDNHIGRTAISQVINNPDYGTNCWWIDTGNGYNSGQVLIGNTCNVSELQPTFDSKNKIVTLVPAPSLQAPFLLQPAPEIVDEDCAEAVNNNVQSKMINQQMAVLVLEFVRRILNKDLTWIGAYLDMDEGTLKTVPAEPYIFSRMFSIDENKLIAKQ
ncbi:MAG: ThiF family adenylyltransferase [Eubacteriales bacterium]